jgi:NAD(P)-dependent dehydrogenase (short-subunit alcohol dehydrogenase family)
MDTLWSLAWITGASSGIGRALALRLARAGVTVAASARSAEALADLARAEPRIKPYPLDVTDAAASAANVARIEAELGAIDLAILNAGIGKRASARRFDPAQVAATFGVNVLGATNPLGVLLPAMVARGRGHVAFVASVAGYRGLPGGAGGYGPSKAALINLAEALHPDLARYGVAVSVINPGYVETPMTAGNTSMPFVVPADEAARRIIAGLSRRRFEIAFPWPMVLGLKAGRLLPYPVYFALLRLFAPPPQSREDAREKS